MSNVQRLVPELNWPGARIHLLQRIVNCYYSVAHTSLGFNVSHQAYASLVQEAIMRYKEEKGLSDQQFNDHARR
jgi:hypothetical protein